MNEFIVAIDEAKYNVLVSEDSEVKLNENSYNVSFDKIGENSFLLKLANKFYEIVVSEINGEKCSISVDGYLFEMEIRTPLQEKARKLLGEKASANRVLEVKAPMPGMILKVNKKAGDKVTNGESIIILEAMKMENELSSPAEGKIKEIFISEGSAVEKGLKLFSIET